MNCLNCLRHASLFGRLAGLLCTLLFLAAPAVGQTTQPSADPHAGHNHAPGEPHPPEEAAAPSLGTADRNEFARQVDLAPLRALSVQHVQTLKTWDSMSRQIVANFSGKSKLDGQEPLYTYLDLSFRPEAWMDRPVVRVKNVPFREDLAGAPGLSEAEKARIVKEGTISLNFWMRGETQAYVMKIIATSTHKQEAAQQVDSAASWMLGSMESPNRPGGMQSLQIIPPPDGHPTPTIWLTPINIAGNVPELVAAMQRDLGRAPPPVNGVSNELASRFVNDLSALRTAWIRGDAADANKHIAAVADALPKFTPSKYPSALKRNAEVVYNRMTRLALPGVAFYFTAFVLFIMAARSGGAGLRKWGFRFLLGGFAIHVTAIGIRWWLVEKATDDWFHAIPIKNQYESVLWSVFLGIAAALVIMALLRSHVAKSIIGVGAGFLGWLGLLAIWITPYVTGREIGAEIGQVNGVLMSYWLYIHVTTVVFSYGLITIGFALSVWWLWRYYGEYGTVSKLANQRQLSADAVKEPQFNLGIATPALATGTVAKMQFAPNAKGGAAAAVAAPAGDNAMQSASDPKGFLATLDLCNLVVLQLAFWVLGAGIIFGAIWADMSWGRPWGWDPKETFALVTWIVYLVVVHVRVVTPHKAWWTAVLSIAGFFIMLFNWIGVNFFLVGLHSYA